MKNSLFILILGSLITSNALAAIVADGTLGTSVSHATNTYAITAGTQRNGNLFHSFSQFNLAAGEVASFNGSGVTNIISRITGGASNIDGTVRSTISGANLFLLNPAGIIFGPNASLDLTGSFHASTADYLRLGNNGGIFYADPNNPAITLTIDPPSAFGFLRQNPSAISLSGSYLAVPQGRRISLVSGGIDLTNANLWSYSGTINLISVGSAGEAVFNGTSLSPQGFGSMGRVSITEDRPFQPLVYTGTGTGMDGFSIANLDSSGQGGGRIVIRAGSFLMSGGSVFNDAYGSQPQGSIDIQASNSVNLRKAVITGTATDLGSASGGAITMTAPTITITDNSFVGTDSFSSANGADITLKASDSITVDGQSKVSADTNGTGTAGSISLSAPNISILYDQNLGGTRHTALSSSAMVNNAAGAGSISIDAADSVTLTGSLNSQNASGTSGTIAIRTGRFTMAGSGLISTSLQNNTTATSASGNVSITANDIILGGNSRIESRVVKSNIGKAGTVSLNATNVTMRDKASISSSIDSINSTGGTIVINASEKIQVASNPGTLNGELGSIASETTSGNAGHINLNANNIQITNNATVSTFGKPGSTGSAGNIAVVATQQLSINSGFINTQSASSSGGNITIAAPGMMNVTNGEITASATAGSGNGGNVTIDAGYLTLNNGLVTARAEFGNGGNLLITVSELFVKSIDSFLSASSRYGQQGTVVVNAPNTDVTGALAAPVFDILNLNAFIPKRCMATDELNSSTFRILGSDGLPPPPENSFPLF